MHIDEFQIVAFTSVKQYNFVETSFIAKGKVPTKYTVLALRDAHLDPALTLHMRIIT
jgi:hypothetical protein